MFLGKATRAPKFVTASSPKGLERAMLLNNIKFGLEFKYFDIQKQDGAWFAWFAFEHRVEDVVDSLEDKPKVVKR